MSWEVKSIGDVCEVIAGQSPEGSYYNDKADGMPFYQGKKEFGEKFIGEPTTWTTYVTKVAEPGDILMSVRAPVGPVNFTSEQICIGRGLAAIRPRTVDKEFLFYTLLAKQDDISGRDGAVFPTINKREIEAIELSIPPLPEQQRIVTKLDAAFAALAEAQAHMERNLANARELFESYLNGVFEGKGDGWMEYTLPDLSDNLDSRRVPITKSDRKAGPYPYYGASGIVDHVHDFIFDEECLLISEDGANLLMRSTPIAFSVSGKYWVNNHAHILRFRDRATHKLVEHYLESIDLSPWITGAAQPKLNQSAMNSIPIWLPVDLNAREDLVQKLDAIQQETKQLESTYQQKLMELEGLKKGLLGAAFRGEL